MRLYAVTTQLFSVTGTAPTGAAAVRATLGQSPGAGEYVRLDDVSLVPEPMTVALLGLGGLFLCRRK